MTPPDVSPVSEAARSAAADALNMPWAPVHGIDMLIGELDLHSLVQAFARFEQSILTRAAADGGVAGWRLVPVEPTKEMIRLGFNAHGDGSDGNVCDHPRCVYQAMLSAAPPPPMPSDDLRAEVERLREIVQSLANCKDYFGPGKHALVSDYLIHKAASELKDTPR